jgi:hypothetical protein
MERGDKTLAMAEKKRLPSTDQWVVCFFEGLFSIEENGRLRLTDDGQEELIFARATIAG